MSKSHIIDILPNGNQSAVLIRCPVCGATHGVSVDAGAHTELVTAYIDGTSSGYIQDVLKFLSDTEREQIQSGLCPAHQETVFDDHSELY